MSSSSSNKARGFAALDPERRRDISRKGGIAAHRKGTAHQWDQTAAREAGRKGGLASRGKPPAKTPDDRSEPQAQPQGNPANDTLP
jgi:uncharacterized protein